MSGPYKQYLGDSVYADFDGFMIILTTENGRLDDPSNTIALEPQVLEALNHYVDYLRRLNHDSTKTSE